MWFNCEHCQFIAKFGFDNRYVGTTNSQGIFGICITHKSLLSTRASDLYTWYIQSLYFKILLCTNLMTKLEFPIEFVAIAYEFLYLNITIALQIHLQDVQIQHHLSCKNPLQARKFYLKIHSIVKLGGSNINFHWTYLITCNLPVIALLHKGIFGEETGIQSLISATCSLTASPGSVFSISHIQINRWQFADLMQQTKLRFKAGAHNYWT